jgi:hypothetical protein
MWKTLLVLLTTALAIVFAWRALEPPIAEIRIGAALDLFSGAPAPLTPPLMYAGIRG